ncbi:MAG: DUF2892 domain-containing protein [Thermoleophilia bacterium]
MTINMHPADRLLRAVVVAPVLIIAAMKVGHGTLLGVILFVLAAVMLLTAAVGNCPLYMPLGLSTCKRPADKAHSH